jgi:hypothetical protein
MLISLVGQHSESLCTELEAAGIAFVRHPPIAGDIRYDGQTVEVIADSLAAVSTVALVFKSWIRARSSRKIILTARNYKVFDAGRLSVEEISHLLVVGKRSTAVDTSGIESRKSSPEQIAGLAVPAE